MKTTFSLILLAAAARAQPPALIRLIRGPSFPAADAATARSYSDARAANPVLGMTSISGLAETWLIEMHDSFASIETIDKALSATPPRVPGPSPDDLLSPARNLIALYRPGWSYRPDEAMKMTAKAHYFMVSVYRIRPGTESDFSALMHIRKSGLDRLNLDRPDMAYEVVSGAPMGTFVFLAPMVSLQTLDNALARAPVYAEGAATASKIAAEIEISREHLLFRVQPSLSYVSDQFVSADPEFWTGKPKTQ